MSSRVAAPHVVSAEAMPGVRVVPLKAHADPRGRFLETYREQWFPGRPAMVQQNRSDSEANVLRGLHYHLKQADYWYVPAGRVLVALADLRKGSPVRGAIATFEIGDGKDLGVYIPPGVAHGYYAAARATMTYLVDRYYDTNDELGVAWDDPSLAIPWPFTGKPILSGRDEKNARVADLDPARLPRSLSAGAPVGSLREEVDVLPLVVTLVGYLFVGFCLMQIAEKTNTENSWFAFVPILNLVLTCQIGGRPVWWLLGLLVPFLNLAVIAILWISVAQARRKPPLLGLLIFVPLVNVGMIAYLAFSE